MRKFLLTLSIFFAVFVSSTLITDALETKDISSLPVDLTLVESSQDRYLKPDKILFTRVATSNSSLQADPAKWIGEIHYYMVTRLGFVNVPFNYFIDRQGNIYDARNGYEGVVPELADAEGVIVVGYLSNDNEITTRASRAFSQFISEQAGKYSIDKANINAVELEMVEATDSSPAKVTYINSNSVFASNMAPVISSTNIQNVAPSFTVAIEDLNYAKEIKAGEKLEVKLKLRNSQSEPMFIAGNNFSLVTADGQDSPFAVNGTWDSFKNVTMLEQDMILPGQTIDVSFELQALLTPGEQTESFKFTALTGVEVRGSGFDLNFTITKGDFELVEITPTETGKLNVRETPAFNGRIVAEVEVGRILVTTGVENGWYKIKVNDSVEGWVLGRYVRPLE